MMLTSFRTEKVVCDLKPQNTLLNLAQLVRLECQPSYGTAASLLI